MSTSLVPYLASLHMSLPWVRHFYDAVGVHDHHSRNVVSLDCISHGLESSPDLGVCQLIKWYLCIRYCQGITNYNRHLTQKCPGSLEANKKSAM